MTLTFFQELAFEDQVAAVWDKGRYIATRFEEQDTVGLYVLEGSFFVELYYDNEANHLIERIRPFLGDDADSQEGYAPLVKLADLTP